MDLELNNLQRLICHKPQTTNQPIIGSLKTAIEEEWNKMSKEFILVECKSFHWHVDTIIEKKMWPFRINLLFCVYLLILLFTF